MAFAVVLSLAQTIRKILDDNRYPISIDGKFQLESIHEQVIFLQKFLESFPRGAISLERRIRNAANEAEDIIEHFMYEQIRWQNKLLRATAAGIKTVNSTHLYDLHELKKVMEEIDAIAREAVRVCDFPTAPSSSSTGLKPIGDTPAVPRSSSTAISLAGDDVVVGFDEDLINIRQMVLDGTSTLQVIPIVGMEGIGKTTVARITYDDAVVMDHFDIRAWVKISQDYQAQDILWNLLNCMNELDAERSGQSNDTMIAKVHRNLRRRRYLIVLDDMWSTKLWNEIKDAFPDNHNGSRIMLTTRLLDVALAISSSPAYQMHFMDPDASWNLLRRKVFKRQNFPLESDKVGEEIANELEKVGREIVRRCGGLPLAIVLIAGLLSTVSMTPASWKEFAENLPSAFDGKAKQLEKIILLSYTHLPHHLRSCFLYVGVFPGDCEIHVSKLIKLWIAEGFVKPSVPKSFEEEAAEYLKDLIHRNLVLVTRRKSNGEIKCCSVHDVVRELCKRKAVDENFRRRFNIDHSDLKLLAKTYGSTIRSVLCFQPSESSLGSLRKFRLLRVLDVVDANVYSLPAQVFELFHLRYLAFGCPMEIPAAISMLQNLQTLIICRRKGSGYYPMDEVYLPLEIWTMPLLRHLVSFFDLLPDPEEAAFALENLQTLSVAIKFVCTERILKRIPNLRKLGITYFGGIFQEDHQLQNLVLLSKLEELKLIMSPFPIVLPEANPVLPVTLKKLTLSGWRLPWKYMNAVGSLPNLQVLKLRHFACGGHTWKTTEGGFLSLKYLLIDESDLEYWITESTHFPSLGCLVLYRCFALYKIPCITTLVLIEVDHASELAVESAKRIQKEQQELGNEGLQVRFVGSHFQVRHVNIFSYLY